MTSLKIPVPDLDAFIERSEAIYRSKYQKDFEANHRGKFVALDPASEEAYLGDSPEEALDRAEEKAPGGFFHLLKVGARAAYYIRGSSCPSGLAISMSRHPQP